MNICGEVEGSAIKVNVSEVKFGSELWVFRFAVGVDSKTGKYFGIFWMTVWKVFE